MLKIWKKRWKDSVIGDQDGGQQALIGGPDVDAFRLESTAAVLPTGVSASSSIPNDPRSVKRLASPEDSPNSPKRHSKKLKVSKEEEESRSNLDTSQVLEMALRENTIVSTSSMSSLSDILRRFICLMMGRIDPSRRIILIVVDDDSFLKVLLSDLRKTAPNISLANYSKLSCGGSENPWREQSEGAVFINSSSLQYHLTQNWVILHRVHSIAVGDVSRTGRDGCLSSPVVQTIQDLYRILDTRLKTRLLVALFSSMGSSQALSFNLLSLEATLNAKIYGSSAENRAWFLGLPYVVQEAVVLYDSGGSFQDTRLANQLHALEPSEVALQLCFSRYRAVLDELGTCAADMVWRRALKENRAIASSCPLSSDVRRTIEEIECILPVMDMSSQCFNVTPKFLKLMQILKSCQDLGDAFRGIVFVQRREVAFIMVELLQTLNQYMTFIRPRALVDGRLFPASAQCMILRDFASGAVNLLVATQSVGDLDIPKASVVVHFNTCNSQISQAYARSCACEHTGHVVHLLERGHAPSRHVLSQINQASNATRIWTNILCRSLQSSVPKSPLPEANEYMMDSDSDDDDGMEEQNLAFIQDPVAGGKICLHNAANVLYKIGPQKYAIGSEDSAYYPFCEFGARGQEYTCRILLPIMPLAPNWSPPSISKAHARRLAAFEVCMQLFKAGVLEHRLFPTPCLVPRPTAPPPPDTTIAGTRRYDRRAPRFWRGVSTTSTTLLLYPTVITVDCRSCSIPSHAPILFLTRHPLPAIPDFKVFFAGLPATVHLTAGAPFSLDAEKLEGLLTYTTRLWRGILNKHYTCFVDQAMCFCAPVSPDWDAQSRNGFGLPNIDIHIRWDLVTAAAAGWIVPLKYDSPEELASDVVDAVIQDRWTQYTRRYDVVRVRSDLSPLSKPEEKEYAQYDNLIELCKIHRKDFEGLSNNNQPLIEVSKFPSFVDRLNPAARPLTAPNSTRKHFIPELCAKVTVPASTLRTALLLPCVMRRIDDFLLVKELNAVLLTHSISEQLLHAALSTPSVGIEYDYERLELLGDAFLKYLSSIYVFVMYPGSDEGALHNHRQSIISNKTLFQSAITVDLPSFILSRPFSLKFWLPPNSRADKDDKKVIRKKDIENNGDQSCGDTTVTEASSLATSYTATSSESTRQGKRQKNRSNERPVHWLGDKAIADVSEAIIGAAFLSGGRNVALKVTKHLNLPVPHVEEWSDFSRRAPIVPAQHTSVDSATIEAIESIIGTKFKRPYVLAQALTHASITGTESTSYERLEFIGDAILDFMVIQHIFDRNPQMSPGGLTLLKGAMVSNSTLAAVCIWAGLHHYIVLESAHLTNDIRGYAGLLEQKQADEYAAAAREGRLTGQYWHNIEPPKILSDVVESIIGAIYVSDDYTPAGVDTFFANVLKPFYDRHVTLQTVSHHPTKILFELIQAKGCQQFQIIKEENEYLVLIHDVVLASGQCGTELSAAKLASLMALDALDGDPGFLQRTCDCWKSATPKKAQKKASEAQRASIEHLLTLEEK